MAPVFGDPNRTRKEKTMINEKNIESETSMNIFRREFPLSLSG
jgi:hypothetical protein